jgi:hypothetical protein
MTEGWGLRREPLTDPVPIPCQSPSGVSESVSAGCVSPGVWERFPRYPESVRLLGADCLPIGSALGVLCLFRPFDPEEMPCKPTPPTPAVFDPLRRE